MIFIPHKGQKNVEPQIEVNSVHEKNGNTNNTKVNLNTASVSELMSVPELGKLKLMQLLNIATNKVHFKKLTI